MTARAAAAALAVLAAEVASAQPADRLSDFKAAFLGSLGGAQALPRPVRLKAGDLLRLEDLTVVDGLEECLPAEVWAARHRRGDYAHAMRFTNSTWSGRVSGEVSSAFALSGDLSFQISESLTEVEGDPRFDLDADDLRLPPRRAAAVIGDDPSCAVFVDAYVNGYLPDGLVLIGRAFFMGGAVTHRYGISLGGQGSGSVEATALGDFLRRLPFVPDRIADLFSLQGDLAVGGDLSEETGVRLAFGSPTFFADGYMPLLANPERARRLLDIVADPAGEVTDLDAAAANAEAAFVFLEANPDLDMGNPEALVLRVHSGDGLVDYASYVADVPLFGAVMSRILAVNRAAGRFDGI